MNPSELALWRYSIIAPLLHVAPGSSVAELARTLASEPKIGPKGHPLAISSETILRWLRRCRLAGLAGLEKTPRKDRGSCRALSESALKALLALADEHPTSSVRLIHRKAEQQLGRQLSLKATYRLLAGHRRRGQCLVRSARRREVGVPQTLWLADTMHGPRVSAPRRRVLKSYLIALMDDASRAIMAARFTTADDVKGLIPILREAILARGCPSRLLCDNGPNYRSRVLRTACATLGIHLVHASPYRPTSKARLERFFLTVRLGFEPTLPQQPSLSDLNQSWAKFLGAYHARPHSALTALVGRPTPPLSYYLCHLPADIKYVSELSLDELLVVEETRRVGRDGTIRVAGRLFEVDPVLAGERVLARFNPADPTRVLYRPLHKPDAPLSRAFPIQ
jgi:transposase InsO family protein